MAGLGEEAAAEEVLASAPVRDHVRDALTVHNRSNPGSSTRVARVLLMAQPPSIDADEITDKGYINQRAVRDRRPDLVSRLMADQPDPGVIVVE